MRYLKNVKWLAVFLAVVALAGVGVWIWARGCGDNRGIAAPASGSAKGTPAGWHQAAVVVAPRIENPWHPSEAGKKLKPFVAGTELVEVKTPSGETVQIAILPGGEVVVPDGYEATVYQKPGPLVDLEARPWIGAGLTGYPGGIGAGLGVGVDVVRAWRFHGGPAGVVSWRREAGKPRVDVAGGLAGSYNLWRNVDARAVGMYGTAGAAAFVGVGLGIQ